jgi:hypothetical protein
VLLVTIAVIASVRIKRAEDVAKCERVASDSLFFGTKLPKTGVSLLRSRASPHMTRELDYSSVVTAVALPIADQGYRQGSAALDLGLTTEPVRALANALRTTRSTFIVLAIL